MLNQFSEQTTNGNLIFTSNLDFYGRLESTLPEQSAVINNSSSDSDFDDYFMELELEFDE